MKNKTNMKIMKVSEYNRMDMIKYNKRVEEWKNTTDNNIIPQIAFVGFRNNNGSMKKSGYVAMDTHRAFYNKTLKGLKYELNS